MTGIERLRAISGARDEWVLGGTIAEIADQIEREHDAEVADSPYDAILPEDRDALAWVRKRGGLDHVRAEWNEHVPRDLYQRKRWRLLGHIAECETALGRRREIISKLGHRVRDLTNENAELRRRTMPEGMEWPRYEDGEPVPIGGEFMGKDGKTYTAKQIQFIGKCFSLFDFCDRKPQFSGFYGERVRRPAVLAADSEPLEVGQTVWSVNDGTEYKVVGIRDTEDADGDPCKIIECSNDELHIYYVCIPPDKLTHTKPEIDSWERIEEDKGLNPFDYCKKVGHKLWTFDNAEEFKASDLVRRCRALAEKENRNE